MKKWAAVALLFASTALAQQPKAPLPPQHAEYDIDRECVINAIVNPKKFHCFMDSNDLVKSKKVVCDNGSFVLQLKEGRHLSDCLVVHVSREEGKGNGKN